MSQDVPKPRLLAFEVTGKCRFTCRHCRAHADLAGDRGDLSTSQCKQILLALSSYTKCVVIFTGGEPMERGDIVELIGYTRSIGLRAVMASCGYLLDEGAAVRLKEVGLLALSFSLDGASAETHDVFRQSRGAFDAVMMAVDIAKHVRIPFQINTTISKINQHEVIAIADLVEHLGATCFNPFILVPTGRGRDLVGEVLDPIEYEALLNELLRIKRKASMEVRVTCGPQFARVMAQTRAEERVGVASGCIGGREFGFISRRGDVQTCGFLNIPAGNLIEQDYDFASIWERAPLLQGIRDRKNYTGRCRQCQYLDLCGGCRARAYAACGDYLGDDPVCHMGQA